MVGKVSKHSFIQRKTEVKLSSTMAQAFCKGQGVLQGTRPVSPCHQKASRSSSWWERVWAVTGSQPGPWRLARRGPFWQPGVFNDPETSWDFSLGLRLKPFCTVCRADSQTCPYCIVPQAWVVCDPACV